MGEPRPHAQSKCVTGGETEQTANPSTGSCVILDDVSLTGHLPRATSLAIRSGKSG